MSGALRLGRSLAVLQSALRELAPTRLVIRSRARSVLDHRPHLDGAAVPRRRDLRGERERIVDVVALDEIEAAEVLLRLRERAVGRNRIAVVDADGRGAGEVAEVGAALRLRPLAQRHVLLRLSLLLLGAQLLPAVAGAIDQERVLHGLLLRSLTRVGRTGRRGIDSYGLAGARWHGRWCGGLPASHVTSMQFVPFRGCERWGSACDVLVPVEPEPSPKRVNTARMISSSAT